MIQLPREGCNVSVCLCYNSKKKNEIISTEHWRAKAINRPVPLQTVNYETGET